MGSNNDDPTLLALIDHCIIRWSLTSFSLKNDKEYSVCFKAPTAAVTNYSEG
jgi:hypothetical protein